MKAITADWLISAKTDIETIDAILGNLNLGVWRDAPRRFYLVYSFVKNRLN